MDQAQDSITTEQFKLLNDNKDSLQLYPFSAPKEWYEQQVTDSLSAGNYPREQKNTFTNDWVTILLLICFALFAWVRYFHSRRLDHIYKAVLARHLSNQMIKEGNLYRERISLPLQALGLLSLGYFIFLVLEKFSLMPWLTAMGLEGIARVLIALSALWFIKLVAVRLAGFLFKTNTSAYIYNLNMLVYLTAAGIILLPFSIISTYLNSGLIISLGLLSLALIFLLWVIRGISVGLDEKRFSVFHLFLYLCTFEILPVLILLKIVLESN